MGVSRFCERDLFGLEGKGYGQKKEEDVEYGFSLLVLVCSVKETKGSSMGRAL